MKVRRFIERLRALSMGRDLSSAERPKLLPDVTPSVTHVISPSADKHVVAASGVTFDGVKIILSVSQEDLDRALRRKTMLAREQGCANKYLPELYDCRVDFYGSTPSCSHLKSESLSGLIDLKPLIGRFSDGSLIVVCNSSDLDARREDRPNATIFRGGVKTDTFCVGPGLESIAIDSHDNIWICPSQQSLESREIFAPRGESDSWVSASLAPICLKSTGEPNWPMMPWGVAKNDGSDWCGVNTGFTQVGVYNEFYATAIGILSQTNKNIVRRVGHPLFDSSGFAFSDTHLLAFFHDPQLNQNSLLLSNLGEDKKKCNKYFSVNEVTLAPGKPFRVHSVGENIHIRQEEKWLTFNLADVVNQGQDMNACGKQ